MSGLRIIATAVSAAVLFGGLAALALVTSRGAALVIAPTAVLMPVLAAIGAFARWQRRRWPKADRRRARRRNGFEPSGARRSRAGQRAGLNDWSPQRVPLHHRWTAPSARSGSRPDLSASCYVPAMRLLQGLIATVAGFLLMIPLGVLFAHMNWPVFHPWALAHGSFTVAWPLLSYVCFVALGFVGSRWRKRMRRRP
jgi:hypothetical protein